jgi:D-3-phosphoglycerate dehydrogenase / 2-oxoglutarate reductase
VGRFRVVVTDRAVPDVTVERDVLAGVGAEVTVAHGSREDVLEAARDADALLNTYLPLDANAIARLVRCRVIARYGVGVDNVDLDAARNAGIVVTNVPDYCVEEVATHTLALILALVRKLPQGDEMVRAGRWGAHALGPIARFSELTVGLVGYGRIARRLAATVRAMGAEVGVHDPYVSSPEGGVRLVKLDQLLATADVVSLHCPLTAATHGLLDAARLGTMKPGAVLVNASRGPLVVQHDLFEALRHGVLAAAALDVFEREPPDAELLAGVPNLLVTPHAAFYSETAVRESRHKAATQVARVLAGQPPDYAVT